MQSYKSFASYSGKSDNLQNVEDLQVSSKQGEITTVCLREIGAVPLEQTHLNFSFGSPERGCSCSEQKEPTWA